MLSWVTILGAIMKVFWLLNFIKKPLLWMATTTPPVHNGVKNNMRFPLREKWREAQTAPLDMGERDKNKDLGVYGGPLE